MKAIYLTCALFAVIISSLSSIDANVVKGKAVPEAEETTVAHPSSIVTLSSKNETIKVTTHEPTTNSTDNHSNGNTKVVNEITTATTAQPTTDVTKAVPSSTLMTSKEPPSTKMPVTNSTAMSTSTPMSVTDTPANNTSEVPASTSLPVTTAVPPMGPPTSSPDSKERHFDGLSFLGGIILATCLMAIAAFSWKFYKTCNERNYGTL